MKQILITTFTALGLLLSGASHALQILKPDGTRTEAQIVGKKLMIRDATGKLWTPARDGTYKTNDGKALIVQGGTIAATRGGSAMGADKPEPKPGPKPDKMTTPRMGGPAAIRGGSAMESDKPEPKPGPKPDKMTTPRMGGPAATTPGGLRQVPVKALPMPQGTERLGEQPGR